MDADYEAEDQRLKRIFESSRGMFDREAIEVRFGASRRDAWIVVSLREIASPLLLDRWLCDVPFRKLGRQMTRLTFRTLWRVACNYPFDSDAQHWALEGTKRGKGDHPFRKRNRPPALDGRSKKDLSSTR